MRTNFKTLNVLAPGASLGVEDVFTSPVDLSKHAYCAFAVSIAEGAGTYTITAESVNALLNPTEIKPVPFTYKTVETDEKYAPEAGISLTDGETYVVFVNAQALALNEHSLVRLKFNQTETGTGIACVTSHLMGGRLE